MFLVCLELYIENARIYTHIHKILMFHHMMALKFAIVLEYSNACTMYILSNTYVALADKYVTRTVVCTHASCHFVI